MTTKKKSWLLPLALVLVLISASCANWRDDTVVYEDRVSDRIGTNVLDKLSWSDTNYRVLNQLIKDNGIGGKYYNRRNAPYVVLDWDQTCTYLDVEEAIMRYQLFHLRYKLSKDQFTTLFKDSINGVTQLSGSYNNIRLADCNRDIIADYNYLYENYSGLGGTKTFDEIQLTPQYADFIAKVPFLYSGYCETTGIGADYGYSWVLYLFAGLTIDEVRAMAKETISYELANQISKQTLQSPAGFQTFAGAVSYTYKTGLRVMPEMQNLIATLTACGIDVYIVTASYKPVVEEFSGIGKYGYNVPPENVIGMELATSINGTILPEYKSGWVKPYRQGKVDAINSIIKSERGKISDPLFSAGDSDGDYEMSTKFPGMKLTLIWNRVKGGDIGTLCRQAVDEKNHTAPRYILQGRNENTGITVPFSETILFGKTVPQLLYEGIVQQ